jgi:hypothetical protein
MSFTPTQPQLAESELWRILTRLAHARETIRYSKLAKLTGFAEHQDELRTLLQRIRMVCTEHQLPILSALVVDDIGRYQGLTSAQPDAAWERARIFEFDWSTAVHAGA